MYNSDTKLGSPKRSSSDNPGIDTKCPPGVEGGKKVRMPQPRARRPLVARNRITAGLNRKQTHRAPEGPLKPMVSCSINQTGFRLGGQGGGP